MYHSISEFIIDWDYEAEATVSYLQKLTQASLKTKAFKEGRTIRQLAWHLVTTIREMIEHAGHEISGPTYGDPPPEAVEQLISTYLTQSTNLKQVLLSEWVQISLTDTVPMYGETWKRGEVLQSLLMHQVHHRGQLSILMRIAQLPVPGIYGPSQEEWQELGMMPIG